MGKLGLPINCVDSSVSGDNSWVSLWYLLTLGHVRIYVNAQRGLGVCSQTGSTDDLGSGFGLRVVLEEVSRIPGLCRHATEMEAGLEQTLIGDHQKYPG